MRHGTGRIAGVLAAALMFAAVAVAEEKTEPVGPKLPEKLSDLLLREMNAVYAATMDILDALVRGDDARVAEQAQAIHDSFILKQEMTEADREALRAAVPAAFVERDRAFHQLTGALAAAARAGDRARQLELFGEVIAACGGCHQRYATDRFPGFVEE